MVTREQFEKVITTLYWAQSWCDLCGVGASILRSHRAIEAYSEPEASFHIYGTPSCRVAYGRIRVHFVANIDGGFVDYMEYGIRGDRVLFGSPSEAKDFLEEFLPDFLGSIYQTIQENNAAVCDYGSS